MVSYYEDGDDSTSFRRFNSHGHGYPLSHDREHYSTAGHAIHPAGRIHQVAAHEPRTAGLSPESDSNSRPRSRIPVAVRSKFPLISQICNDRNNSVVDAESARSDAVAIKVMVRHAPIARMPAMIKAARS